MAKKKSYIDEICEVDISKSLEQSLEVDHDPVMDSVSGMSEREYDAMFVKALEQAVLHDTSSGSAFDAIDWVIAL